MPWYDQYVKLLPPARRITPTDSRYSLPAKRLAITLTGMDYERHPIKHAGRKLVPLAVFSDPPKTTAYAKNLTDVMTTWLQKKLTSALDQGLIRPGDKLPYPEELAQQLKTNNPRVHSLEDAIRQAYLGSGLVLHDKLGGVPIIYDSIKTPITQSYSLHDLVTAELREYLGRQGDKLYNQFINFSEIEKGILRQLTRKNPSFACSSIRHALYYAARELAKEDFLVLATNPARNNLRWKRIHTPVFLSEGVTKGRLLTVSDQVDHVLRNMYRQWPLDKPLPTYQDLAEISPFQSDNRNAIKPIVHQHLAQGLIRKTGSGRAEKRFVVETPD